MTTMPAKVLCFIMSMVIPGAGVKVAPKSYESHNLTRGWGKMQVGGGLAPENEIETIHVHLEEVTGSEDDCLGMRAWMYHGLPEGTLGHKLNLTDNFRSESKYMYLEQEVKFAGCNGVIQQVDADAQVHRIGYQGYRAEIRGPVDGENAGVKWLETKSVLLKTSSNTLCRRKKEDGKKKKKKPEYEDSGSDAETICLMGSYIFTCLGYKYEYNSCDKIFKTIKKLPPVRKDRCSYIPCNLEVV
eukprot:gnl/MRDRNA2_/MRDRNA2_162230_c0_seq1.p1 gnl/MRDRNA2_/MRDRNA2_162230_c0~~gnl/MRDRNA2_/MRDRNA2_162230_c0_seq1.p1  ORF type:complete len:243 (+),score=42.88 gnl/MRDRNA2_/MRDRNA2_162230_c0_seq1:94-822(+)